MDKTDGSSTRLLSKTIIPFQVQWVVTALWLVVGRGNTNVDNLYYYHANMAKPKISNVDVERHFPLALSFNTRCKFYLLFIWTSIFYLFPAGYPECSDRVHFFIIHYGRWVSECPHSRGWWGEVMCNVMLYYCNIRWDQHLPSLVTTCF